MKKSLSLIVAIAMIVSLFSSVAFAADKTAADKFNELKAAGIFTGTGDGDGMELSKEMDRASAAVIVARLAGLTTEASTTKVFDDVDPASAPAPYIAAAVKAGIIHGDGNGKFRPYDKVQQQELAVMLVEAYSVETGEKVDTTATADVTASAYALPYIKAALDLKLFGNVSDWTGNATREDLVNSTYATNEVINAPAGVSIVSAKATGAKVVTVSFDNAVDKTKATASLKKDNVVVYATSTWSDDSKTLTLTAPVALGTGNYTVTISGVDLVDGKNTATFTVAPERIDSIVIDQNGYRDATTNTTVTLGYKLLNQYGEDVTKNYATGNFNVTSTEGAPSVSAQGTVTVTGVDASKTALTLSLVDKTFAKTSVQTVNVLAPKAIGEISISAPAIADGDSALLAGKTYELPYTAKDQYGNDVNIANATDLGKVTFVSSDSTVLNIANIVSAADNKINLTFSNFDGPKTVTLTAIVTATGKTSQVTLNVNGAAKSDTPALVAPTDRFGQNDTAYKVQLSMNDQYGNAMKADDILTAANDATKVTITSGNTSVFALNSPKVVKDGDKAYVSLKGVGTGTATLTVTVNSTGKSSSISLTVVPAKVPSALTLSPSVTEAVYDGVITLKGTFKDQYGDDFTAGSTNKVTIETSEASAFDLSATTTDVATLRDTGITLTGATADKSTTLTVKMYDGSGVNANLVDQETVSLAVLKNDAALTYTVADLGTIADAAKGDPASAYAKAITVTATDSAGVKVAIPNVIKDITVSDSSALALDVANHKVAAKDVSADSDQFVNVTIAKPDGSVQVIAAPVKVATAAPAAVSIAAKAGDDAVTTATVTHGNTDTALLTKNDVLYFVVTDQYGTTALSTIDNVSIFVTAPSGAVTKLDALDLPYDFTTAGDYTVTAVIGSKSVSAKVTAN